MGCHVWTGSIDPNGYGLVNVGSHQRRAHRLMWEHVNGPIPSGLMVRHDCANRACVNPAHLLVGTAFDNAQDTKRHGHLARGQNHWASKLTDEDIASAFEWRQGGMTYRDIADRLAVSYTAIHYALNGRTWRHAERPEGLPERVITHVIQPEAIETARRMRDDERRPWREIEKATGYTRIHLMHYLPRRTGYNQAPHLPPDEADEAVRLRADGLSWTKLARHFGNRISRMGFYYAWRDGYRWWREAEDRVRGS